MSSKKTEQSSTGRITRALNVLIERDPYLTPYKDIIHRRLIKISETEKRLTSGKMILADFAAGHEYFGLHFQDGHWILREWAPNATAINLVGDMTDWQEKEEYALQPLKKESLWEIQLPAEKLHHNDLYRLRVHWPGGEGDRIPAYARRVVQDADTKIFNARVGYPEPEYQWRCPDFRRSDEAPFIYEVHVGMAQEEGKIGTFREFTTRCSSWPFRNILTTDPLVTRFLISLRSHRASELPKNLKN